MNIFVPGFLAFALLCGVNGAFRRRVRRHPGFPRRPDYNRDLEPEVLSTYAEYDVKDSRNMTGIDVWWPERNFEVCVLLPNLNCLKICKQPWEHMAVYLHIGGFLVPYDVYGMELVVSTENRTKVNKIPPKHPLYGSRRYRAMSRRAIAVAPGDSGKPVEARDYIEV